MANCSFSRANGSASSSSDSVSSVPGSLMSRDIQVPIYHAPPSHPHEMPPPPIPVPSQIGSNDSASQPSSTSVSGSPLATTHQGTPVTSVPTPSNPQSFSSLESISSTPPDQQQLRQNYERLRQRITTVEAETADTYDGTRADLRSLSRIFEDIFSLEGLPAEIFNKMKEASEVLSSMKKRLR